MGLEDAITNLVQAKLRRRKLKKVQPDQLITRRPNKRTKIEEDGHTMLTFLMILDLFKEIESAPLLFAIQNSLVGTIGVPYKTYLEGKVEPH